MTNQSNQKAAPSLLASRPSETTNSAQNQSGLKIKVSRATPPSVVAHPCSALVF